LLERVSRRRGRADVVLGIVLGIVLGMAVIAAFVFLGSEDTIDAPRVTAPESGGTKPGEQRSARP
jgi:hypothetical protein